MQYQLFLTSDAVLRIDDDGVLSTVPNDPANRDWQDYQLWLADDNTPLPADE